MDRRIIDTPPSYYWPENAIVIVLECGHRHVRPRGWKMDGLFDCCFCDDDKPQTQQIERDDTTGDRS